MTAPAIRASLAKTGGGMADERGIWQKSHNDLVLSFLAVRRAIGALGFFLPLALLAYGLSTGDLLPSISSAYYSPMREVFVGCLMAQAVFLWSYEGFRPDAGDLVSDKATARVAAVVMDAAHAGMAVAGKVKSAIVNMDERSCFIAGGVDL